jgi:hypothetical protein
MADDPVEVLRRWQDHGAIWRIVSLGHDRAIVDLCTCYGEPVDRLESSDPDLLRYVRENLPED